MSQPELLDKCHEALRKAFASQSVQVRLAYCDLAEFYARQASRLAMGEGGGDAIRLY